MLEAERRRALLAFGNASGRLFRGIGRRLDPSARIRRHPWLALDAGLLVGFLAARRIGRRCGVRDSARGPDTSSPATEPSDRGRSLSDRIARAAGAVFRASLRLAGRIVLARPGA